MKKHRRIISIIVYTVLSVMISVNTLAMGDVEVFSLSGSTSTNGVVTGTGTVNLQAYGSGMSNEILRITSSDASSNCVIYISIEKPNGLYYNNSVEVPTNSYKDFVLKYPEEGLYKIHYLIIGTSALSAKFNP